MSSLRLGRVALAAAIIRFSPMSLGQVPDQPAPTFHASSSLVLLDLIAQDPKTGLPLDNLGREDFQVFDNNIPVPIASFDTGKHYDARPIALWLVVICNEQNQGFIRSGAFVGHESLFRFPLDHLDKRDRVGVAHWCDNGDAELDLHPSEDRDLAIRALVEALKPIPFIAPRGARVGELAVQEMFRSIIRDTHHKNPEPLPVAVLLYGDLTGMPLPELNAVVDDFLETSGIVFGIKDASVPEGSPLTNGEQSAIFHYMAVGTGGQYFAIPPGLYASALDSIILQLHFRYQIGFKPSVIDGKRHRLRVELVGDARKRYKRVSLRYRPEYIPTQAPPAWQR